MGSSDNDIVQAKVAQDHFDELCRQRRGKTGLCHAVGNGCIQVAETCFEESRWVPACKCGGTVVS